MARFQCRGWNVVVLHADNDFVLHCQLGRISDSRTNGFTDRERRRLGKADQNQVRRFEGRQHRFLLQSEIIIWFHASVTSKDISDVSIRTQTSRHIKRCGPRWKHSARPYSQQAITRVWNVSRKEKAATPSSWSRRRLNTPSKEIAIWRRSVGC